MRPIKFKGKRIEDVVDFAFDGIYTAIDTAIAKIKKVQP